MWNKIEDQIDMARWDEEEAAAKLEDDLQAWREAREDETWMDDDPFDVDDGPTSCKDIISDADYDLYYSD